MRATIMTKAEATRATKDEEGRGGNERRETMKEGAKIASKGHKGKGREEWVKH